MVRLVFRPYTQLRRSICTSESLRTSTRVSSGFILARHSSPSFGSQHVCSRYSPPARERESPGPAPRRDRPTARRTAGLHSHCAFGFSSPNDSHTCWTPWSVFQDGSGGSPTYSPQSEVPAAPAYRPQSRSRGAPQSGHHVEDRRRASQDTGGSPFPPRGDGSIHPGLRRPRNGSRRPTRGEVRPWRPARKGRGLAVPGNPTCGLRSGLNPPVRPSRFHPFSSQRFHALLNSLFKVLFNFPSRYLFAIGLVVVFSLRWSLPPALGCSFKQPDSTEGPFRAPGIGRRASHPPRVVAAFKLDLAEPGARKETLRNVASLSPPGVEVRGYTLGSSLFGRTY